MSRTDSNPHADVIDGLRRVADQLAANPDAVSMHALIHTSMRSGTPDEIRAGMVQFAEMFSPVTETVVNGSVSLRHDINRSVSVQAFAPVGLLVGCPQPEYEPIVRECRACDGTGHGPVDGEGLVEVCENCEGRGQVPSRPRTPNPLRVAS